MEDEDDVHMSGAGAEGTGGGGIDGFDGEDDASGEEGGHDFGEHEGTCNLNLSSLETTVHWLAVVCLCIVCAAVLAPSARHAPCTALHRLFFLEAQNGRR